MTLRVLFASCLSALLLSACGHSPEPANTMAPASARSTTAPVIAPVAASPSTNAAPNSTGLMSSVYVWQRAWMPANVTALNDSKAVFSELRVLAAQQQPGEGWIDARVDLDALKSDGRIVRQVIRIDGRLPTLDTGAIAKRTHALVAKWRAAGVHVDGIEIDFDCPSSRLGDYAKLLAAIRPQLPNDATLSVTALPAWIGAPGLADVLTQSDEAVLQVHAVSDPKHGLFDSKQARQWIDAFARQTTKAFRVALPAYGSALVVDAEGHTVGVESEATLAEPGARMELFSDPREVAGLLRDLEHAPPPNLRGIVWFRLPLPGDRRAWPLTTIVAVINGKDLHNSGNLEAVLPASVDVGGTGCGDADALPGYRIEHAGAAPRFVRETHASLPATQSRPIGWVRCTHLMPEDLHVHP
jgi:hypothetical protein